MKHGIEAGAVLGALATIIAACEPAARPDAEKDRADAERVAPRSVEAAISSITAERHLDHIQVLASDEFAGRAPGTAGEDLSVDYLIAQFEELGLAPGNQAGRFDVPGGVEEGKDQPGRQQPDDGELFSIHRPYLLNCCRKRASFWKKS